MYRVAYILVYFQLFISIQDCAVMKPYTDKIFKQLTRTIISQLKLNVNMLFILFLVSGTICMKTFLFSISFSYLYSYCVHFSYLISLQDPNARFHESRYKTSYSYIFIRILFTVLLFSGKSYGFFFSLPKMNGQQDTYGRAAGFPPRR